MPQDLVTDIQEQIASLHKAIETQKHVVKSSMNDPEAMDRAVQHLRELIVRLGELERNLNAAKIKG
jgi:regulator of replication initiation timing